MKLKDRNILEVSYARPHFRVRGVVEHNVNASDPSSFLEILQVFLRNFHVPIAPVVLDVLYSNLPAIGDEPIYLSSGCL
jgi:hypothetical protein